MTDDRKDIDELILEIETTLSRFQTTAWVIVAVMVLNVAIQMWRVAG